ncbi:MAG: hypothetical protein KJO82_03745, partial [Gammaproteobacteria bacterium]|nr:hypothetical protein [Gammaproteobacteria bacterium]
MIVEQHAVRDIGGEHLGKTDIGGADLAGSDAVNIGRVERLRQHILCTAAGCDRYDPASERLILAVAKRYG